MAAQRRERPQGRGGAGEEQLPRARGCDQPRLKGGQGWSPIQLHRTRCGGRRRRPGWRRLRQGEGSPAAISKGVEEAKKNFFRVPRIQGTIPHPVTGEKAAGVVLLRPASPRYRSYRRWPSARRARVCRSPRRAEQVAWIGQRDQHRSRDRSGSEGNSSVRKRLQRVEVFRWKTLHQPLCCAHVRPEWQQVSTMAELKVTQTRSGIGGTASSAQTLHTLGLRRIGDSAVREDRPEVRGMLRTVSHLVAVEEVEQA